MGIGLFPFYMRDFYGIRNKKKKGGKMDVCPYLSRSLHSRCEPDKLFSNHIFLFLLFFRHVRKRAFWGLFFIPKERKNWNKRRMLFNRTNVREMPMAFVTKSRPLISLEFFLGSFWVDISQSQLVIRVAGNDGTQPWASSSCFAAFFQPSFSCVNLIGKWKKKHFLLWLIRQLSIILLDGDRSSTTQGNDDGDSYWQFHAQTDTLCSRCFVLVNK